MATNEAEQKLLRQVSMRVPEDELRAWRVAAALRGVSLSEWMRKVLTHVATTTKEGADV